MLVRIFIFIYAVIFSGGAVFLISLTPPLHDSLLMLLLSSSVVGFPTAALFKSALKTS